jgi:hypothetical protein
MENRIGYDLIGDIHGHAEALARLLELMGYREEGGTYRHPEGRKVVFLGDFVDRGPAIREVLRVARSMVEAGTALAVMGNHELNAIAYHPPDGRGGYLRPHTPKNNRQVQATLEQLSPAEMADALAWFRTLPPWLDLGGFRVVHACWDDRAMRQIERGFEKHGRFTDAFMHEACDPRTELYQAIEVVLKGPEVPLPGELSYPDMEGVPRSDTRIRWFQDPGGHTYGSYSLPVREEPLFSQPLTREAAAQARPYPAGAAPVFFGHYWLVAQEPAPLAGNVACLDYSVAAGGFLCGYRWDGEGLLLAENFRWAKSRGGTRG